MLNTVIFPCADESGTIQSPYYPDRYPDDKDCYYLIRQEPGHVNTLMITDLDIERHGDCKYDYLEVSLLKSLNIFLVYNQFLLDNVGLMWTQ